MSLTATIEGNTPSNFQTLKEKATKKWEKALPVIKDIFKKAILTLLGIGLFAINPTVFAVGFLVGVIFHEKVQESADKVVAIWDQRKWQVMLGVGLASILCVQVTWAAASIGYSAYLGSHLTQKALEAKQV